MGEVLRPSIAAAAPGLCWEKVAGGGAVPKCHLVDPRQTLQKVLPIWKADEKWTPWHVGCSESSMAE